jgi:hypothetical protein
MAIYYNNGLRNYYYGGNSVSSSFNEGRMYYGNVEVNPGYNFIGATGGTVTYDGDYKIHTFTTVGTSSFNIGALASFPVDNYIELLVVAGGGGGGGGNGSSWQGSGGGGGGVVYSSSINVSSIGAVSVIVGDGGTGGIAIDGNVTGQGNNGQNSSYGSVVAIGGGGAGAVDTNVVGGSNGPGRGKDGGSGGGGGAGGYFHNGGSGTTGQGNSGGSSVAFFEGGGGGGGGAGSAGGSPPGGGITPGSGGDGIAYSISGVSTYYGAGAPGGTVIRAITPTGSIGLGGVGIGQNGNANTGQGAGGAADPTSSGAKGGSGVVIVKYKYKPSTSGGGDADATAYINAIIAAGGTLSGAQQTAIDTFFVDLKADGIYSKLYFMYPFLGGVANSNKINALNPGTYDLTFNGPWTHSTTGSYAENQETSPSSYADTGYDINTSTADSNWSFGYIHKPKTTGAPYGYSGTGPSSNYMVAGWSGTGMDIFYPNFTGIASIVNSGGAFFGLVRNASNSWKGAGIASGSAASGGFTYSTNQTSTWSAPGSTTNIWYNRINPSGFNSWGLYTFGFAGQALSDSEMTNLAINVNSLQIAIGNNIFS